MKRCARVLLGLALLVLAVAGTRYGLRAGCAQAEYYRAKYGILRDQPARALELAERAHARYPLNFYLCSWAGEVAYYGDWGADAPAAPVRRELARRWCERGLALNGWYRPLRLLEARLAADVSLPEAIRLWESYVDWQFWDPYNHAVLAEFYSRGGRYEQALEALTWVRGSPYEEAARRQVQQAWADEIRSMQGAAPRGAR